MKRFHVHVSVRNLDENIRFYSSLFGQSPSVEKADYAKWMLDDPRVNFAISTGDRGTGVNHLGLQVDTEAELESLESNLATSGAGVLDEKEATCCYAHSDKHWTRDPQGVVWEAFHTHGEARIYGDSPGLTASTCCG